MKRLLLSFLLLLSAVQIVDARSPKVGLVLGGGGAKGAAEIGALKYIEKFDIPIDYIAGSSIGAVIGCLYAAGYTATDLEELFCGRPLLNTLTDRREDLRFKPFVHDTSGTDTLNYIFGFPALNFRRGCVGLLSCDSVEYLVDSLLKDKNIQDFRHFHRTHFRCVATDFSLFSHVTEKVLSEGSVAKAVRASMAFPLVIKHQEIDDQHMVDGGMMNNLPIDVVKNMGAEMVIVVDLQQAPIKETDNDLQLDSFFDALRFFKDSGFNFLTTLLNTGLSLGRKAAAALVSEDKLGIIGWALHRPDYRKYLENLELYDDSNIIYIRPLLPGYNVASFGQESLQDMVNRGEAEAKQHKNELANMMRQTNRLLLPLQ